MAAALAAGQRQLVDLAVVLEAFAGGDRADDLDRLAGAPHRLGRSGRRASPPSPAGRWCRRRARTGRPTVPAATAPTSRASPACGRRAARCRWRAGSSTVCAGEVRERCRARRRPRTRAPTPSRRRAARPARTNSIAVGRYGIATTPTRSVTRCTLRASRLIPSSVARMLVSYSSSRRATIRSSLSGIAVIAIVSPDGAGPMRPPWRSRTPSSPARARTTTWTTGCRGR